MTDWTACRQTPRCGAPSAWGVPIPVRARCRTDECVAAVEPVGPPVGAAAVVLAPVAAPDAVSYVAARADAGSSSAEPLVRDFIKSVGGDESTALQPLAALRQPRTIGILIKAALGAGCTPAERLLVLDVGAAGIKLRIPT